MEDLIKRFTFNTPDGSPDSVAIRPGDVLSFDLEGVTDERAAFVDRIQYTGEPATLCLGDDVTIGDHGEDAYIITDFGVGVNETDIAMWVRPATG